MQKIHIATSHSILFNFFARMQKLGINIYVARIVYYLRDREHRLYIILLYLQPCLQFPSLDMMMMMVLQLALLHSLLLLIDARQLRAVLLLALERVTHAPYDPTAVPASAYAFLAGLQKHRHYFFRGSKKKKQ